MTEEELKTHCEKMVVLLSQRKGLTQDLTKGEERRLEEHQLVLDIIDERDEWKGEAHKLERETEWLEEATHSLKIQLEDAKEELEKLKEGKKD